MIEAWTRRDVLRTLVASAGLPALRAAAAPRRRVAIIGGGMAGVSLAWLLDGSCDVFLVEARSSIGGNVRSVEIALGGRTLVVDMGAQYFHPGPYPLYTALLSLLGLYPPAPSGQGTSHAFPASWAGDNEPNFGDNGLPSVIIAGQSAAMSGYAIWGHDTGGYQDTNSILMNGSTTFRPKLVIYADDTIANVSASPGGGSVTPIIPVFIDPSNGNHFANHTFDRVYLCNTTGHEIDFTFTLTGVGSCGVTVTTPNLHLPDQLGGFLNFVGVYWWEAYAHCDTIIV